RGGGRSSSRGVGGPRLRGVRGRGCPERGRRCAGRAGATSVSVQLRTESATAVCGEFACLLGAWGDGDRCSTGADGRVRRRRLAPGAAGAGRRLPHGLVAASAWGGQRVFL